MAVRHGYGKIAGADALVFAYDTGDTRNSYKGRPTTNLANTDALRTMTQYADNTVASAAAPERGPGWKKLTITARGTNFRTAKFPYITQPTNTVRTYSMEIDFNGTSGYYIRGDGFSGFSPNQYTSGVYTSTFTTTTNNGSLALFLNNGTTSVTGINDVIYYRYYQVEDKPHRTQFTEGTRSSTQGLLALTGNSTIDLANVSFDSNAQITFDGTNDGIDLGAGHTTFTNKSFAVEAILYPNTSPPAQQVFFAAVGPVGGPQKNIHFRIYSSGAYRMGFYSNDLDTAAGVVTFGEYNHVVMQYDYSSDTSYIYVNGQLNVSGNQGPFTDSSAQIGIGYWPGSGQYFNGEIPVTKLYNRVLTAAEVKNNYNNYKGRFNI